MNISPTSAAGLFRILADQIDSGDNPDYAVVISGSGTAVKTAYMYSRSVFELLGAIEHLKLAIHIDEVE